MCEPVAIATTALSVGSQMYGQHQQYKVASAQADAQNQMYAQNRQQTYEALGDQYADVGIRQSQEQQTSRDSQEEVTHQARAAMATARVSAGEAGVSGSSVRMGLRDIGASAARDRATLDRNKDWTIGQLQRQKTGLQSSASNRISSLPRGQSPSTSAALVGMAGTAAQGYANHQSMQPKNNPYSLTGRASAGRYSGGYFRNG
ncbi:hypothetical protein BWR19_06250 [Halomonas sp. 1513]|nr:hypothetical protein BWR19_06250 [Halomonas sp. 1513]